MCEIVWYATIKFSGLRNKALLARSIHRSRVSHRQRNPPHALSSIPRACVHAWACEIVWYAYLELHTQRVVLRDRVGGEPAAVRERTRADAEVGPFATGAQMVQGLVLAQGTRSRMCGLTHTGTDSEAHTHTPTCACTRHAQSHVHTQAQCGTHNKQHARTSIQRTPHSCPPPTCAGNIAPCERTRQPCGV